MAPTPLTEAASAHMRMVLCTLCAGQVGLHQLGGVGHQALLPLAAQPHLALDQPAHHAHVVGPAHRIAAHHPVAAELQAQVPAGLAVGQLGMFTAGDAGPVAKAGRGSDPGDGAGA